MKKYKLLSFEGKELGELVIKDNLCTSLQVKPSNEVKEKINVLNSIHKQSIAWSGRPMEEFLEHFQNSFSNRSDSVQIFVEEVGE